jgi:hypothetical protein
MSFAVNLSLPKYASAVESQVNQGIQNLNNYYEFLNGIFKAHANFAQEIDRLVQQHRTKCSGDNDKMALVQSAWISLVDRQARIGKEHAEFARRGRLRVSEPLRRFTTSQAEKFKQVKSDVKQTFRSIVNVKNEVEKEKQKVGKAIESVISDNGTFMGMSVNKFRSKKRNFTFSMEKVESNMKVIEGFNTTLDHANTLLRIFWTKDLPSLFTIYQMLEEQRIDEVKRRITRFTELSADLDKVSNEALTVLNGALGRIQTARDIEGYIATCQIENEDLDHGDLPVDLIRWDFPVSFEDVKKQAQKMKADMSSSQSMELIFGGDLSLVMDSQARDYPELKIPLMFLRLWDQVIKNGGFQAEGIFRIAPEFEQTQRYRKQIIRGDYDIEAADPHLSAALLKRWLRELTDPLIPFDLYEDCVSIAKSSKITKTDLEIFLSRIPMNNRNVFLYLIRKLLVFLDPKVVEKTKMNLASLSIIFSPCCLRCNFADASKVLQNAKLETKFIEKFLKLFTLKDLESYNFKDPENKISELELAEIFLKNNAASRAFEFKKSVSNHSDTENLLIDLLATNQSGFERFINGKFEYSTPNMKGSKKRMNAKQSEDTKMKNPEVKEQIPLQEADEKAKFSANMSDVEALLDQGLYSPSVQTEFASTIHTKDLSIDVDQNVNFHQELAVPEETYRKLDLKVEQMNFSETKELDESSEEEGASFDISDNRASEFLRYVENIPEVPEKDYSIAESKPGIPAPNLRQTYDFINKSPPKPPRRKKSSNS